MRGLAAVAADPAASHDARLTAACQRVEAAVATLVSPSPDPSPWTALTALPAPHHHPGAEAALTHLHGLERALGELAAPLRSSPRAALAVA